MIRVHLTAADFARVRFAPRPAPLQELNVALMKMCLRDEELLFGRWRRRLLRSLPGAVRPMADLVPAGMAPLFIDVFSDSLEEGLETVRASPPALVRSEIERVYAGHPSPAPPWVRRLHHGDAGAWHVLRRAQHSAFETVLRPLWPLVQDLHQREFTRHALLAAEHGVGAALTGLVPGTGLRGDVWELQAPCERDIQLRGQSVLLLPTFHWTGHPLVSHLPGRPLTVTYPAGPGLPLSLATGTGGRQDAYGVDGALAAVLGRTRVEILLLLAQEHTTSGLARRLGVSNATASAHAAALRGAGLISTVRAGRAVLHRRTSLGSLLVRRHSAEQGGADSGEQHGHPGTRSETGPGPEAGP
ncbi:winged helix-turn-helix domain-containing protein [Streptomyces sp. MST-110588]|uniref:winged helix-turn-helix domain-containing protein n=1 Tax=Streptomyces sp. MST-110588 TaxID=2833628 RepID=UPI001F5E1675|nr:winged helix-turn-helix domain-containing protein [Streptomyces sp. MST-110588]UNO42844.1 winged helix-turn-helix transcriptional regulator [Streptomyces sp. MST-110588]